MWKIDLNCDLGESFGAYTMGLDEEVLPFVSSANVACGYHASDPVVMDQTVARALSAGVAVGAHPGFPDLMGFGRRNMNVTPAEAKAYVLYQVGALAAFVKAHGGKLSHVKPHGALYNMAGKDIALARAVCEGIAAFDDSLILLSLSGSKMIDAAKEVGIPYAKEVFADRAYEADGSLVARSKAGAVITDEDVAVLRVIKMVKEGKVTAIDGREIALQADSVCVHGDNVHALAFVKKIRAALQENGILVRPLSEVIAP